MQELEATEKPNIFDIESVTIEHWKTVTKLPKPKIITQLPNKIKTYIESKVADCTLQSDIIKTVFLYNAYYIMKLSNSKKYDEQLNLTRSSVKKKNN